MSMFLPTADDLPRCERDGCTAESEGGGLFCAVHRNDPTYDVLFQAPTTGTWLRDAVGVSLRQARQLAKGLGLLYRVSVRPS